MHTHVHHARGWIAIVAILVLIAAHVWLFTTVSRAHLSLALAAGMLAVAVSKFAWWKFRRPPQC
ncbi:MAG TPA: hypothetical protein VKA59_18650 [Vicinamibacterales bacterium]|nr:hypothetical protein [Vicinamibacterales bacterium]